MITQRLILAGSYPDGVWTCASCGAELEGGIEHQSDCRWLAEFAATERERCASLADQEAANLSDVGLAHAFRAFADQLRKQP